MRVHYKGWIEEYLGSQETGRDDKWTSSIAVGSKGFVEKLKSVLIGSVSGRKVKEAGEGYQLREPSVPYKVNFDAKNDDIGPENRHFWDIIAG
jgi:putative transposase